MEPRRFRIGRNLTFGGLATQLAAIVILRSVEHPSTAGFAAAILAIAATLAYLIGLGFYAKAKGHSPAWGLLGLLSLFGLTLVLWLPDLE